MENIFRTTRIIYNTLRYNYILRQKSTAKKSDPKLLYDVLDKYKQHESVFVHIGLSPIKDAYQTNPYDFILDALTKRFKNIIAPGFTPSFRKTRLYHKLFSVPEYGTFSSLFLKDSNYRTDDPIHSLLIFGNYRFENSYTKQAFGAGSSFEQLDRDNLLCINIGTKCMVSSLKHYIEYKNNLPYIEKCSYNGIIYYDKYSYNKISTINYEKKYWLNKYVAVLWNNHKMSKQMKKEGILNYYNLDGIKVYIFRLKELRIFLERKLKKNPYYLIT